MSIMTFIPRLRTHLNGTHVIYTVRGYRYTSPGGLCIVEGVGKCKRMFIREITTPQQLIPYLKESGFFTVESWWDAIQRFTEGKHTLYLYKVTVMTQ